MLDPLILPLDLRASDGTIVVRRARGSDAAAIMDLLIDDPFSTERADVDVDVDVRLYESALLRVLETPGNDVIVAVAGDEIVGTLQLTVIPGMARRGSTRLTVEAVRVASSRRGHGIGSALMGWVTGVAAPAFGVDLVQLTSNANRLDSHRFYEQLGFTGSHTGFKCEVSEADPA